MPRRLRRLAVGALCLALTLPAGAQWTQPQWDSGAGLPSLASSDSQAASGEEFRLGRYV